MKSNKKSTLAVSAETSTEEIVLRPFISRSVVAERVAATKKQKQLEHQHSKIRVMKDRRKIGPNSQIDVLKFSQQRVEQVLAAFRLWCESMSYTEALQKVNVGDRKMVQLRIPPTEVENLKTVVKRIEHRVDNESQLAIVNQCVKLDLKHTTKCRARVQAAEEYTKQKNISADIISDLRSFLGDGDKGYVPPVENENEIDEIIDDIFFKPQISIIPSYTAEFINSIRSHPFMVFLSSNREAEGTIDYDDKLLDPEDLLMEMEEITDLAVKSLNSIFSKFKYSWDKYANAVWNVVEPDKHALMYNNIAEHNAITCELCHGYESVEEMRIKFMYHPYAQLATDDEVRALYRVMRPFLEKDDTTYTIDEKFWCIQDENMGPVYDVMAHYWTGRVVQSKDMHYVLSLDSIISHNTTNCYICCPDVFPACEAEEVPSVSDNNINEIVCEIPNNNVQKCTPTIIYAVEEGRVIIMIEGDFFPMTTSVRQGYFQGKEVHIKRKEKTAPFTRAVMHIGTGNELIAQVGKISYALRGIPRVYKSDGLSYQHFLEGIQVLHDQFDPTYNYVGWIKEQQDTGRLKAVDYVEYKTGEQTFRYDIKVSIDNTIATFNGVEQNSKKIAKHHAAYLAKNRLSSDILLLAGDKIETPTTIVNNEHVHIININNQEQYDFSIASVPTIVDSCNIECREVVFDSNLHYIGALIFSASVRQKAIAWMCDPIIVYNAISHGYDEVECQLYDEKMNYVSILNNYAQGIKKGYPKYTEDGVEYASEGIKYLLKDVKNKQAFAMLCCIYGKRIIWRDEKPVPHAVTQSDSKDLKKAIHVMDASWIANDTESHYDKEHQIVYGNGEKICVEKMTTNQKIDIIHNVCLGVPERCCDQCIDGTAYESASDGAWWDVRTIRQCERFALRYKRNIKYMSRFPIVPWKYCRNIPDLDHVCYLDTEEQCSTKLYQVYSPKYGVVYISKNGNNRNRYVSWGKEGCTSVDIQQEDEGKKVALASVVPYGMDKRYTLSPWGQSIFSKHDQLAQYMIRAYDYAALDAYSVYIADKKQPCKRGRVIINETCSPWSQEKLNQYMQGQTVHSKYDLFIDTYLYCTGNGCVLDLSAQYSSDVAMGLMRWNEEKYNKYSYWSHSVLNELERVRPQNGVGQ